MRAFMAEAIALLEAAGATYEVVPTKNRNKLIISKGSRSRFVAFSRTVGKCPRASKNFAADVKRELQHL
tara:strand:+ start:30 stop:236 length:207 start_codon:yes stop_codon:yes gene_type:complete